MRIALFPGTFDPVTFGHIDIIERSLALFDKLYIGIGINSNKAPMYSESVRKNWLGEIFKNESKIETVIYEGLTVNCCRKVNRNSISYLSSKIYLSGINAGSGCDQKWGRCISICS